MGNDRAERAALAEMTPERRQEHDRKADLRKRGYALLEENPWAWEAVEQYLDLKDFGDMRGETPAMRGALRAIRQGSGGLLGNPPLL